MRTTIHAQHLPGDLTGFGQIDDGIHDVLYTGNLPHRLQRPENVFWGVVVHGRVDDARRDGVYADALLDIFHRQVARDGFKPAFGNHRHRGVGPRYRVIHQRRGYVDDAAAGLLRQHLLDRELADMEKTLDIDRHQRPQIVEGVIGKALREVYAGIVDEGVDRSEFANGGFGYFRRRRR